MSLRSFSARSVLKAHRLLSTAFYRDAASRGFGRKVYFEVYGCQMNVSDSEVAWSILKDEGFSRTKEAHDADVILAVTCSVRENAEQKIWNRLDYFNSLKKKAPKERSSVKVGILGCMAERLKKKLLETNGLVDFVAGPDAYRDLPSLLTLAESGQEAMNVALSMEETYADVTPLRFNTDSPTALLSIMRGCNNMCSFCIVPFTRGRERSRPFSSVIRECRHLIEQGVKEITLLGQNVNSYGDKLETSDVSSDDVELSRGFTEIYKRRKRGFRFVHLLDQISKINPEVRIRFTSPHPKDFPDDLLQLIQSRPNLCNHIHLPAQSGSTSVLKRMRRGYSREAYLDLVQLIRKTIPGVHISSDVIVGFCGETDEEFQDTMSLMNLVQYDMAYMFAYSMRQKTHAYHKLNDDVPKDVKQKRLQEVVTAFYSLAEKKQREKIGQRHLVLVEGASKRSKSDLSGRNDGNIRVVFPDVTMPDKLTFTGGHARAVPGDYVAVEITDATSISLLGKPLWKTSLAEWSAEEATGR
ncbi:mitochondrial tRNA methylthiotransferase CDK5RAP1-like isoform X2 [Oscarella lobularis]|uniref:mitochondrial tRNA methylthiotransferase CDK5RAP1-like isoform X2 n=1 Tax=Oscarella lobularis TaxID=121494 RepID=UPI0033140CF8